ncbi:MAG: hypothetical protein KME21_27360 [Desmonostoc vinosum HA7617-LM4]|jgi:hypothetical protein|nr:hypothetical protein [Desmonostoc vinosum HA7617-LM4]
MKRTVSIPVDLPKTRFLPLMNQCAEIAKNVRDDYILSSTQRKVEPALREGLPPQATGVGAEVSSDLNFVREGTEEQASVNMPDVSTDSIGQLQAPSPCGWGG